MIIEAACSAFDFSKIKIDADLISPDVVLIVKTVWNEFITIATPIRRSMNPIKKLVPKRTMPIIATIIPIKKSLNKSLKSVLTEEICVTGIVSFFLPSGINVRIVFGTLRVKKFCSVEISPFK